MTGVRTTCPYCGVGCGVLVTAAADQAPGTGPSFAIAGDPAHPANRGRLCSKGTALAETLDLDGRLLHPEVRGRRASWDEALDETAHGLAETIAKHGPDSVAFYVSGQLLTEDYYVANKLMKGFIGSANIDTNSRLCMASAVAGHQRAFGEDIVPCAYEDLERAELIVIVGANMAWCHPVLFQRISRAKEADPTMRVVVVDPRRTATAEIADLFLGIRPGTDVVLFNGLLSHLRREDALDWEYLDANVAGFGTALSTAKETAPSIPAVASACGVPETDVAEFYRLFARTAKVVTLFSQGVNQSSSGTDKVNSIINVHLATGRIGKAGAGPFSLTGQPNAMGGREVGGLATQLAAHMGFSPEHVERVQRFWHAPRIARAPGLKAVELFDAIGAGRIKAVWIVSTNPVVSMPDADRVAAALERCNLVIVSDCMRATDTTAYADILLPAAAWGEKSGTVTNSERRISRQRAFLPPAGESRPDWWILAEVARRMGFADAFDYRGPAEIFREHARLSALENGGARAFDIGALACVDDGGYEELEPVRWPAPADAADRTGGRLLGDGLFFTPDGKARMIATPPRAPQHVPTADAPFVLNTGRVRDHWHTMTRTGRSARLSARHVEPFVQVHPDDARRCGLDPQGLAELGANGARVIARVVVTRDVRPGQLFAPMHWNRQFARSARVGTLIPAAVDPISGQPELKLAAVRLRAYAPSWHAFALSRSPLCAPRECTYFARAKGAGHWRHEIAGDAEPESWPEWARAMLGEGGDWLEFRDGAAGRYRAARIADHRLVGCLFAARTSTLPGRGPLAALFDMDRLDDAMRLGLLSGRGRRENDAGPIVCACFSVGRNTLVDAIRTQSLTSPAEIGRALSAGTSCGSCVPELRALLAELRPARAREADARDRPAR